MTARPRRLGKKEQAALTRQAIIEASIKLFARQGFASTSTKDIAEAIGMTTGVLYWHFKDKYELLVAVLREIEFRLSAGLMMDIGKTPGDPVATVEALADRAAMLIERDPEHFILVGTIGAEVTDTDPRIEKALRESYGRIGSVLRSILAEGVKAGAVPSSLDIEVASELLLGIYVGGVLHLRLFRDRFPLARGLATLRRMIFASVMPGPAAKTQSVEPSTLARGRRRR